ncbi:MAG: hypothetical protein ACRD3S_01260 [Terracidiphilus sp.]
MTMHPTGNPAQIRRLVRRSSFLLVAIALAALACTPCSRADSATSVEKHARKMQKHLARYAAGTLLQIQLRNSGEALGSLGQLSGASFQIVSIDSNKTLTFNYVDVASVRKGKEYIGTGSEHHIRRWVPLVAGALLAGGGVAAYETMR